MEPSLWSPEARSAVAAQAAAPFSLSKALQLAPARTYFKLDGLKYAHTLAKIAFLLAKTDLKQAFLVAVQVLQFCSEFGN